MTTPARNFAVPLLILSACAHKPPNPANTDPMNLASRFPSLQSFGIQGVRCEAHFQPMKIYARLLQRGGQIPASGAETLQGPYAKITFFTDGTPCLIQQTPRPRASDAATQASVDHFADVALAAAHGSCQMLQLGFLRLPLDFSTTRWTKEDENVWKSWIPGNTEKFRMKSSLDELEITRDSTPNPVKIRFEPAGEMRVPVEVQAYLEGQGPMTFHASFEPIQSKDHTLPVPKQVRLTVLKEGKDPTKMGLEFRGCDFEY